MSAFDKASIVQIPSGYKASTLYSVIPSSGAGDLSVVRATSAWRVNSSGAWESVAANVPRIDYIGGLSCGELLVEPQRKNLFLNSATGVTQSITVVSGVDYAVSFSGTGSITFSGGATGTLNGTGAGVSDRVSTIITTSTTSVTCTISGTVEYVNFEIDGADAGVSYATSWIETAGSIVTRNADVISKTSIASLLGDSEGGVFVEASVFETNTNNILSINDGSVSNRIEIDLGKSGGLESRLVVGGVNEGGPIGVTSGTAVNTFYKIANSYALNNFSLFRDGTQIGSTDTSVNVFSDGTLTNLSFDNGATAPFYGRIRQLVVFDQALTNDELSAITT